MGELLLTHVGTADLLTEPTFGAKQRRLVGGLLHDTYSQDNSDL